MSAEINRRLNRTKSSSGRRYRTLALFGALVLLVGLLVPVATAAQEEVSGPKIVVAKPVVDLGPIPRGNEAVATFEIENTGTEPLELRDLRTSCACAVGEFDTVIAPGEKGKYELTVDTSMLVGPSTTQGTIGTNDPSTPTLTLTVRFTSLSYLSVEPGYLRYTVHQNFPGEGVVPQTVWSNDGADFQVTGVRTELKIGNKEVASTATFQPVPQDERRANTPGAQWKVNFQLPKDAPVGAIAGWLRIDTDHPQQKTAHLPITGFVRPVIAVTPASPKYSYKQSILAEEPYRHALTVKNYAEAGTEIVSLSTDIEGLELSHETVEEGRHFLVYVTATGALPLGLYDGTLEIETSSEASGTVIVPMKFQVLP